MGHGIKRSVKFVLFWETLGDRNLTPCDVVVGIPSARVQGPPFEYQTQMHITVSVPFLTNL